jgi:hypothetical protein
MISDISYLIAVSIFSVETSIHHSIFESNRLFYQEFSLFEVFSLSLSPRFTD